MLLITGANGFVGSGICDLLQSRGVTFRPAARMLMPGGVAVGDISASTDWSRALTDVNTVVHLAARVHVMSDPVADPLAAFRALNVDATLNLAEQAYRAGTKRLVYLSSIKVNGEHTELGRCFTADDIAVPEDPYGQSKLEAEQGLMAIMRRTGLEIVIVRSPLVYGPGVKANFRVMMEWVRRGIPLPFGAVNNRRSLIALPNLADLILTCVGHPGAAGEVFLAADGEDISTTDLLAAIARAMGCSPRLLPIPEGMLWAAAATIRKHALAHRLLGSLQVDIRKTRERLGWHPPVSVAVGIAATVEAFMQEPVEGVHFRG